MSNLLQYSPQLAYIGAVDISETTYGSLMYTCFIDSSCTALGNILMFEYILQDSSGVTVNTGYISTDNAITDGIKNQWTLSVPSPSDDYDSTLTISVRVYIGLTVTGGVGVTLWSNLLKVHCPPKQPTIFSAFYDNNSYSTSLDDLFVFLDISENTEYFTDNTFMVVYTYLDVSGVTIWEISDPLTAQPESIGQHQKMMLHVAEFGTVSPVQQIINVAVYAVYSFIDASMNYHTVSHISNQEAAEPANNYAAPTITTIDYAVYNDLSSQIMTVNWNAPANSGIPTYNVAYYILEKSTDVSGNEWTEVGSTTDLSYNVNVSEYDCGTNISFRVYAVSTYGTQSPYSISESLNIFKYSDAVQNLTITDASYNAGSVTLTVNFNNPVSTGCGVPTHYKITSTNFTYDVSFIDASFVSIPVTFSGASYGDITVCVVTKDTNNNGVDKLGASATTPYITATIVLAPVAYNIYQLNQQTMNLTWVSSTGDHGWNTNYYVYKNSSIDSSFVQIYNGTGTTTVYNAVPDISNNNTSIEINFYVRYTLTKNSVTYNFDSNIASINTFTYATAPQDVNVLWSVASTDNTTMDIKMTFKNPESNGYGVPYDFTVNIVDNSGILSNKIVLYDASANEYIVNFDDVSLNNNVITGSVNVYMNTLDTNSAYYLAGAVGNAPYTADQLPIFEDVSMNDARNLLTFKVITHSVLSPIAVAIYNDASENELQQVTWKTIETIDVPQVGVTVSQVTDTDTGVIIYTVEMEPDMITYTTTIFPMLYGVAVSNQVGVSFVRA